ncbi:hypothetical protein LCGC14_1011520, partial [marine sediment metagenome]
ISELLISKEESLKIENKNLRREVNILKNKIKFPNKCSFKFKCKGKKTSQHICKDCVKCLRDDAIKWITRNDDQPIEVPQEVFDYLKELGLYFNRERWNNIENTAECYLKMIQLKHIVELSIRKTGVQSKIN